MIYNKPKDIILVPEKQLNTAAAKVGRKKDGSVIYKAVKVLVFFLVLYLGTVVAFILPLRPTYSETEKRNLKEFPKFTVKALSSGEYFDGIALWFSDTFPFREGLTKLNTSLQEHYGFDGMSIHGKVDMGDEIPEVTLTQISAENTTESEKPETTVVQTTQPPTEKETKPVTQKEKTTGNSTNGKNKLTAQTMGAILVAGNSGYEYYNFSSSLAREFIEPINNIKNCINGTTRIYSLIIPTSIDIMLDNSVRQEISSADQKKALNYFNASFSGVTPVGTVYDSLYAHRNEYIYFRTDHHWTALGAYYAYEQFALKKGVNPVDISAYKTREFDGFLGTFYSSSGQSSALSDTPDTVIAYEPVNNNRLTFTQSDGQKLDWPVISDVSEYGSSGKYLTFIAGDQPYEIIENQDIENGESCLVIKDSYGNAFTPFLIPHYKYVHVIDPRHYTGTLSEFLQNHKIDDIIYISNISTTRNSIFIDALKGFVR